MPPQPIPTNDPAALRRRAEARLGNQQQGPRSKAGEEKSAADAARQLHELEVHQIELEMQNEELAAAREKLEALLEQYTDLFDFAPVGYLTLDSAGAVREANLAVASLLGVARSTFVSRPFTPHIFPADRPVFDAFLQRVFGGQSREECELRLLTEGKLPVEVRLEAIVFESGQACRVSVADLTARKRAEADRLILNTLESTRILAGGIAHDFNNLLTVILLNLELAQRLTPPGGELALCLAEAQQSSLLASSLTAQLVTFAQGGDPIRKPMVLAEFLRESVRPALSGSAVRCEFSLAEDLWGAEVDAAQLGQVLRNLILNAREAMPQGGVVFVRAENVVLRAQEQASLPAGEYVRVTIADQGAGIKPDVLPKIFDPYFSTKQRGEQKGMGLGLTICHAVVQKHGGALAVKSEVGIGTTFQLYLPALRMLSAAAKVPAPRSVPLSGRVLVLEDDEAVRKTVGLALWGLGYAVELTEEGHRTVEAYRKAQGLGRPFDVVLLDLTVPGGMGGAETLQKLLPLDPTVKAIVMSGHLHHPVMLEPERHGFKVALAKPFEFEALRELLSRVRGEPPASKPTP